MDDIKINEIIKKLDKYVMPMFKNDSTGHDRYHLKRTLNIALEIQSREGGDRLVIALAAYLHDIHRILSKDLGRYCYPKESLPKVEEILDNIKLDNDIKEKVLHCVEYHEEYNFVESGNPVNDIETLILQDADNIDAMGAIGIARSFCYGGSKNIEMWLPEKPLNEKKFIGDSNLDYSTIHHFYSKLLNLKDNMNTKTGKLMANKRNEFMELYLKHFFDEWDAKI